MKIKLVRTGGFIPVKKVAETETNITDQELVRLLEIIRRDPSASRIKDGQYYELTAGSSSSQVDLEKVPSEYKALFSKLTSNLKFVKEP
jgi:hypothetical protein